jgi:hypothetical protein
MTTKTGPTLKEKLLALQSPSGRRRHAQEIASVLPEIEAALAKGVPRQLVHETLQADGIAISFHGFAKTLYRLRKKTRVPQPAASPVEPPPEVSAPRSPSQSKFGKRKP